MPIPPNTTNTTQCKLQYLCTYHSSVCVSVAIYSENGHSHLPSLVTKGHPFINVASHSHMYLYPRTEGTLYLNIESLYRNYKQESNLSVAVGCSLCSLLAVKCVCSTHIIAPDCYSLDWLVHSTSLIFTTPRGLYGSLLRCTTARKEDVSTLSVKSAPFRAKYYIAAIKLMWIDTTRLNAL